MRLPRLALPLLALALLALTPAAHAGTATAPEITDPKGDAEADALDLVAVWVDAGPTDLILHAQVASWPSPPAGTIQCSDGQCVGPGVALRVRFTVLDPSGAPTASAADYNGSYALVRWGSQDPSATSLVGTYDTAGTPHPDGAANVTVAGSTVAVTIARSDPAVNLPDGDAPGAYRVTGLWAYSAPAACVPDAGQGDQGAPAGCANLLHQPDKAPEWDRAPDSGVGSDFVFPESDVVLVPADANATDAPASTPTATETQTVTHTQTATATATETVTRAPAPTPSKASPGAGPAAILAVLAAAGIFRRR
jgi:hypothetical protein